MPIYDPDRVEYGTTSGHIDIVMDNGRQFPAYWAYPTSGHLFPAIALIHDWWGLTPLIRRLANLFAQAGYYVVAPDLFDGQVAESPAQALERVKVLGDGGYSRVDAALAALESHHNTNRDVAALGIGMGGSLAYEAAITRTNLEAAISVYGFPQKYLGRFAHAPTPILALYGEHEPFTLKPVLTKLQAELRASAHKLPHEFVMLPGVGRNFFGEQATEAEQTQGRAALRHIFTFLEKYLRGPMRPKIL